MVSGPRLPRGKQSDGWQDHLAEGDGQRPRFPYRPRRPNRRSAAHPRRGPIPPGRCGAGGGGRPAARDSSPTWGADSASPGRSSSAWSPIGQESTEGLGPVFGNCHLVRHRATALKSAVDTILRASYSLRSVHLHAKGEPDGREGSWQWWYHGTMPLLLDRGHQATRVSRRSLRWAGEDRIGTPALYDIQMSVVGWRSGQLRSDHA